MNFFQLVLKRLIPVRLRIWIRICYAAFMGNLRTIASLSGTDKWGTHWYAQHYERHFAPLRHKRLKVLEIGVGGGDNPGRGGASLRMWKHYFPRARICGIDIYDKRALAEPGITIFQGDQSDPSFLQRVVDEIGGVDIVIDDGSHRNEHVLISFGTLFPLLSKNGLYCVEDMQTSYWPDFGGRSDEFNDQRTSVGFFKQRVDGLNYEEVLRREKYEPTQYDRHIVGMHFYHNLLIIEKGENKEGSNVLRK